MNIPEFNESTWELIEEYDNQFSDQPLATLDLNPELDEKDLVLYLKKAIRDNVPIKDDNDHIYNDSSDLPEGALS